MRRLLRLARRNFLFFLSRKIGYPLAPADCLQINFTFRCNLRCAMCHMYERSLSFQAQGKPQELGLPVIKKVIKEAGGMGVRSLILIGGEPFLEKRIFELISFANECGFTGITVVTNGTLFSEEIINNMFESRLGNLSISLDAASEDVFARIRGEKVLGKIIEGINLLNEMKRDKKKSYPSLVCVCTVMNQNLEELMAVVGLCRRLGISRIIFQPVVSDNTDQSKNDFNSPVFIPRERMGLLYSALDSLIEYKLSCPDNFYFIANSTRHIKAMKDYFDGKLKPGAMPCYSGYNRIQVVQEGKLYFCVNQEKYEAVFGDVGQDSLRGLWYSSKARFYRKLIERCNSPCLQWCAYRDDFIEWSEIFQKKRIFKSSPVVK